jgi:hypothetical protein
MFRVGWTVSVPCMWSPLFVVTEREASRLLRLIPASDWAADLVTS